MTTTEPRDYDRGLRMLSRIAGAVLATFVFALILFLLLFQWNWLRGPIGRLASSRLEREVRLVGDLDVRLLTPTPTATINTLRIADAPWRNRREPMVDIGRLTVATRWTDLFAGRVSFPLIRVDRGVANLYRDGRGRANWNFKEEEDDDEPTDIPPINNLIVADGRLTFRDDRSNLTINAGVNSSERVSAGGQGRFVLTGRGSIRNEPFSLDASGGALVNIDRNRPYPLRVDVRAGATRLTARGQIDRPFDLARFRATLSLEGPDLGDVYDITGIAMPNTPPYRLSGSLVRENQTVSITGLNGRVGDSDLGGTVRVRLGGDRPRVDANLRSRRLDFDDLLVIAGGVPDANETANPAQRAMSAQMRAERRMMPDATLNSERFRAVDADVTYQADTVNASANLPLRRVSFHASLNNALLVVDRMAFAFPQGEISGNARLNARGSVPQTDLDVRVRGIRIEGIVPAFQGSAPVEGPIMARIRLSGSGNSLRRMAAASNGQITAVIPSGRVRRSLAELSSVNVLPGLLQLLSRDQSEARLSCAIADFRVANGVGTARTLAADTDVVVINGRGTINLRDETLNLHFDGDSKRPRILRVFAPFNIRGRWLAPELDIETTPVVVQTGIAAVLGAVISPLAALLPFLEPGAADDLNCPALESRAAAQGAPTTAPARPSGRRR